MEELLNKLIEKGWKPFNKGIKGFSTLNEFTCWYRWEWTNHLWTIRSIVTKESWLWQFVCENKMIKKHQEGKLIEIYDNSKCETEGLYDDSKCEYRIIESSLKDESELERFLLDNIKV